MNVLVVKLSAFGDILCTTPVFKSLKEKATRVDHLVTDYYEEISKQNPYVDNTYAIKKNEISLKFFFSAIKTLFLIKKNKYDICFIFHRSILLNIFIKLCGIKDIYGFNLKYNFKRKRALELLKLVGLEDFELNLPSELSGGMKQRVSLCRSLVHKPEVLILDEPFAALDAFTREDLWNVMLKLKSEQDFTCILITHDLREAVYLADQVIVLSGRPATLQYTVKSDFKKNKTISDLYSSKATKLLSTLRQQIEIAQSKNE